jgi:acyl-CoA reductase-like NAD-dependent aldehyde dehydrogenase
VQRTVFDRFMELLEPAGPVIAVMPFEDEQDAIRLANDTQYGLSGSLWTRDRGVSLSSPLAANVATG